MQDVEGNPDFIAAHVDTCLAHAELCLADGTDADDVPPQDVDDNVEGRDDGDNDVNDVDLWEENVGSDGMRYLRLQAVIGLQLRRRLCLALRKTNHDV